MGDKKLVPEVRFAKLSGNWANKELGNVFSKIRNAFVGTATPYYVKTGHFYLESNNVKDGKINRNSEIFINEEFYQKQKNNLLKAGDLVMVQSGHVGHAAVIPPELDNTAAHALIIFSIPKDQIDSYFLNFQLQTDSQKLQISHITTGNTIKHILSSEMKKFEAFFPTFEEQTKIGDLFKNLDTLIAQHQTRVAHLANVKKSMLDKMFPKAGADVPEVRFGGFEGKWLHNDLNSLASFSKGRGYSKSDLCKSGSPIVLYGRLYTKYQTVLSSVDTFVKQKENSVISEGNEVIIPASGETPEDIARASVVNVSGIVLGGDLNIIRPNVSLNLIFLALSLTYGVARKEISKRAKGKSVVHVHNSDLLDIEIQFPCLEEQTKIGQFFQNLDTLITQHQKALTQLKNIKQALLHKMFV